jgi:two-component system nitrogen regulation sensor histidine kinase NtrY
VTGTATSTGTIAGAGASPSERRDRRRRWIRRGGYVAAILALISASVTFFILLGLTSIEPSQTVVTWAIVVNGILFILVGAAIGWEIVRLWLARRRGEAGARLHARIVALFALVAVIPAILVAIVANITFAQGADHWFSSRTQQIVEASRGVAEQYIQTQLSSLQAVVSAIKQDVEGAQPLFLAGDWEQFQEVLDPLPALYGVRGVVLIDENGDPIRGAGPNAGTDLPAPPVAEIQQAVANAPLAWIIPPKIVETEDGSSKAFAAGIVMLDNYAGLLLYVVAEFDPQAVNYMLVAAENTTAYEELLNVRTGMQVVFGLIYFGVALMVLAAAIWLGLAVANRLVSPIGRLIKAADNVAGGNLNVEVPVNQSDGELSTLSSSFNKMTHQLAGQRGELVAASDQIDSRRRFIEAVLSGVTAGVIGVDGEGKVTVFNRSALTMVDGAGGALVGAQIRDLVPELGPVLAAAAKDSRLEHRDQITLVRGGRSRTINVRVTTERTPNEASGYVITLDDITDLLTAQRTSVWADVARRIAHEIKNPLTPIQLSAERLRRKFGSVIEDDQAIFDQCVDTIIRQVGDIGRMVDEFSSFARMPKPTLEVIDIREGLRDATFLMQVGHPGVEITVDLPDEPMTGRFDVRLISQVITNLIKNGVEAIDAVTPKPQKARVQVRGSVTENSLIVDVIDEGIGLPRENRQMLLEPYMTTREKGTGLGLAIVRKIVEEHAGTIELMDAPKVVNGRRGAMVRLTFPKAAAGKDAAEPSASGAEGKADVDDLAPVAE